jgi:hypothetical protein
VIRSAVRTALLSALAGFAAACTGLMAGPVQPESTMALTNVSPDSAYKRARANLGTEVFTIVDERATDRWIKATRFPKAGTMANSPAACELVLVIQVADDNVKTKGQWTSLKDETSDKGRAVCDQELADTQGRIEKFASNSQ